MNYFVTAGEEREIALQPENEAEEILQNVGMILSARQGEIPLDRRFGLSWRSVDKPPAVAKSFLIADITAAVQDFEPRGEVGSITFSHDERGRLIPTVEVIIHD